jgi:nucleotide sugar dehydrogenase
MLENNQIMDNKISIIGIGKLGICLSLNLEKCGYEIIGVDINEEYVNKINIKKLVSDEPFVEDYLNKSKNFTATTDIKKCLLSKIIFITVATPSLESGKYDHSQIENAINQILQFGVQIDKKYLVINCTTMPTYCEKLQKKIKKYNYEICYNPEFIAQGSIIKDQVNADTVLIGCQSNEAYELISNIYKKLCINSPSYHRMSTTEAEITKIALNCFLTTKIAYANMVGDISKKTNCNPDIILKAIASDSRVGNKYLKHGFGFGGPCFPRDNRAFGLFCEENGIYPHINYATDQSNKSHILYQLNDFENKISKNEIIVFNTITYKPESTILEESQQLKLAYELTERGYKVNIIEREKIINKLKDLYGNQFIYTVKQNQKSE